MPADQGPVVQRAMLVGELGRLRKEKDLTQKQVAERLDWSPAKMIRIEGGKQSITQTDLEALLRLYGVDDEERVRELLHLSKGANKDGWWSTYRNQGITPDFLRVVGYEAGASVIRQSQNSIVPGVLQTREYAEIITRLFKTNPDKVVPTVNLRMERQARLAEREQQPRQVFVMDEAVIRRHVGFKTDPGIMPRQLQRMAEAAQQDDVEVRIIPFRFGSHQGMRGPLLLLSFDGPLEDVLYREGASDGSLTDRFDVVAEYSELYENLLEQSLGPEDSVAMILEAAERMLE